jgi:hypothetical protein
MSGVPGQPSGYYPRTAEHRAAISAGVKRSWADPEKRAARMKAMAAAWDDPLLLAVMRAAAASRKRRSKCNFSP